MKYSSSFTHDLNFGEIAENWLNILFKDGKVKDIAAIDNSLIHQTISAPIKKFYICSL